MKLLEINGLRGESELSLVQSDIILTIVLRLTVLLQMIIYYLSL